MSSLCVVSLILLLGCAKPESPAPNATPTAALPVKFRISGVLQRKDGTPLQGNLQLAEVEFRGKEVLQKLRFNKQLQQWNTQEVSTDEKGHFVMDVDRKFFDPNAQYTLLPMTLDQEQVKQGLLGVGGNPLVFKVKPTDPELNLGIITVEVKRVR